MQLLRLKLISNNNLHQEQQIIPNLFDIEQMITIAIRMKF